MGDIWISQLDKSWKKGGVPLVATGSGFVPGRFVWRHNGTTWVSVWSRETTPPSTPTVTLSIVPGTKNQIKIGLQHGPVGPIKRTVVKVSYDGTWPSNPGTVDQHYYSQVYSFGDKWSEWFTGPDNAVGLYGERNFPEAFQTFSIPLSTWVRVSAWAKDENYNWSAAGTANIATLSADPPAPVLREVAAAFNCEDAGEWSELYQYWTDFGNANGYASAGGIYGLQGYWFYHGLVASNLRNMIAGLETRIYIGRVNSAHGVSGPATIRYGVHRATSKIDGTGWQMADEYDMTQLNRGEGKWLPLGSSYMPEMKNGTICGGCIGHVGVTPDDSPWFCQCYGRGTVSGQWYMRWQQY